MTERTIYAIVSPVEVGFGEIVCAFEDRAIAQAYVENTALAESRRSHAIRTGALCDCQTLPDHRAAGHVTDTYWYEIEEVRLLDRAPLVELVPASGAAVDKARERWTAGPQGGRWFNPMTMLQIVERECEGCP